MILLYDPTFIFQFLFEECSFKVQKGKEGTGRIVMWNMGISNSFTMEVPLFAFPTLLFVSNQVTADKVKVHVCVSFVQMRHVATFPQFSF